MRLGINTLFMVPGDVGGTETYLRETLLAALHEYRNVDFILFTNLENHEHFEKMCKGNNNVTLVCLKFRAANRPVRILLEQIKLPFVARRYNLDLLWSPGYTAPFVSFCRQIVTICDLQYKSYPEDMSRLERATLDFLVRGACRMCDAVLAISEFSRQEIIHHGFAEAEKVHTVLLGVDETFGKKYSEEQRALELRDIVSDDDCPYILCVAHTYPHKRVDVLIEAYGEVMDKIPHKLVIVGRARRGEEQVQNAASSLKDSSRLIRFSNGLPYSSLQMLFQSADMFVLPSAYEGFGLPVIEAMMAGVPVITTEKASLKEVAGDHAFTVENISRDNFAEQILKLNELPARERAEMVKAAKMWAESFTWRKSVKKMFEVFQSISQSSA